ncbi:MAG: hypothetical protein WA359_02265 [Acidimicrobiales bacterium]
MIIGVSFVISNSPAHSTAGASSVAAKSPVTAWSASNSIDADLTSVSCPTTDFCLAVSLDGDAFTYNGTSWSTPTHVDVSHDLGLGNVSCASENFCVALGEENGVALTYNGTTWSPPKKIYVDGSQSVVSCPVVNFCVALETTNGDALTYNGTSWSASKNIFPDGSQGSVSVSCTSANFCVAMGVSGAGDFGVTYNGTSWSVPTSIFPAVQQAGAEVSCASPNYCVAMSDAESGGSFVSTYNGTSWSTSTIVGTNDHPALNPTSISCASANFCAVVGANGDVVTYDDASWSTPTYYTNEGWDSVSCPSTTFCAGVGGGVIIYHGQSCTPTIDSVSHIESGGGQSVTISGDCLGSLKPFTDSETPFLRVVDGLGGLDGAGGWSACSSVSHSKPEIICGVSTWTNKKIVLDVLSPSDSRSCNDGNETGACPEGSFGLADSLLFQVWNPTSGIGPGLYRTTVAPNGDYTHSKAYLAGEAWAEDIDHYTNRHQGWFLSPSCMTDDAHDKSCYNPTAVKYLAQLKTGESNAAFDLGALSKIDKIGVIGMQQYLSYVDPENPNPGGPEVAELIARGFSTGAAPAKIGRELFKLMADRGGGSSYEDAWLMNALTKSPGAAVFFFASLQASDIEKWSTVDQGFLTTAPSLGGTPLCTYQGFASQCFEAVALNVAYSSLMGYANYPEYAGPLSIRQLSSVMFAAERDFSGEMTATNFIAPWFIQFGGTPGANPVSVVDWVSPLVNINGAIDAPTGAYIYNAQNWLSRGWTVADVLSQVAATLLLGPAIDIMVDVVGERLAASVVETTFASAFEDSGAFWEAWDTATETGKNAESLLKLSYKIYDKTSDILTANGDYDNLVNSGTAAQESEHKYFLGQMVATFHEATADLIKKSMLLNEAGHVVPDNENAGAVNKTIAEVDAIVTHPKGFTIKGGVPLTLVWTTVWAQYTAAGR